MLTMNNEKTLQLVQVSKPRVSKAAPSTLAQSWLQAAKQLLKN